MAEMTRITRPSSTAIADAIPAIDSPWPNANWRIYIIRTCVLCCGPPLVIINGWPKTLKAPPVVITKV
ncbi:hypothetical protein D3C76_1878000 [compost metagenome]